jgi:hypothetical protein
MFDQTRLVYSERHNSFCLNMRLQVERYGCKRCKPHLDSIYDCLEQLFYEFLGQIFE